MTGFVVPRNSRKLKHTFVEKEKCDIYKVINNSETRKDGERNLYEKLYVDIQK